MNLSCNLYVDGEFEGTINSQNEINVGKHGHIKGDLTQESYRHLYRDILSHRSYLGKGDELNITIPANPDTGHRAYKSSYKLGMRDNNFLATLGFRYAYHDLNDNDTGFLQGTKITFLDTELSYSQNEVYLEKLSIFSLASLPSISSFFTPFSFRLNIGFDKNFIEDTKNAIFTTSIGAGFTYGGDNWYTYIMLDPLFYISDSFTGGLNGSIGLVASQGRWGKTFFESSYRVYHTLETQIIFDISQDFSFNQHNSLSLEYQYLQLVDKARQTSQISYNFYF